MLQPQKRVFYVDSIRAYAIFLVVVSHVFAPICWGMNEYPRSIWWIFNLADSVIRLCVPLFVMISGKLLLGSTREESYLHFVGRRFAKVVTPFFVWYMIYRFSDARLNELAVSPATWVLDFFSGTTTYHLYFMYIILGLYWVAPFLRRYVQSVSLADVRRVIFLWFGYLVLQFLFPAAYGNSGPAATLIGYGGYFLLGYYLDKEEAFSERTKELVLLSVVIIVINAFATYRLAIRQGGQLNEKFYYGLAPLVAMYAACFFLVLKNIDYDALFSKWPPARRGVTYLSRDSYNIYLLHMLILWLFTKGVFGFTLSEETGQSALIGVPLTTAAVLGSSLGISFLLQKIPWISRFLVIPAS